MTATALWDHVNLETLAPVREYVAVTADRTETPTSLTGAPTTVLDQTAFASL